MQPCATTAAYYIHSGLTCEGGIEGGYTIGVNSCFMIDSLLATCSSDVSIGNSGIKDQAVYSDPGCTETSLVGRYITFGPIYTPVS
jgi:hypothetical protein